jgi:hypothetical protein
VVWPFTWILFKIPILSSGIVQNKCIWGLEMGLYNMGPYNDVSVQTIVSPTSGVSLGNEQVIIKIKNHGITAQSNIPWTITWSGQGSGSFTTPTHAYFLMAK